MVLVRPALWKLRGIAQWEPPSVEAEVAEEFVNRSDRPTFMRARWERSGNRRLVRPLARQGSHVISTLAAANCLVEVPEASTLALGAKVLALVI